MRCWMLVLTLGCGGDEASKDSTSNPATCDCEPTITVVDTEVRTVPVGSRFEVVLCSPHPHLEGNLCKNVTEDFYENNGNLCDAGDLARCTPPYGNEEYVYTIYSW